jgi:hypothetical protein
MALLTAPKSSVYTLLEELEYQKWRVGNLEKAVADANGMAMIATDWANQQQRMLARYRRYVVFRKRKAARQTMQCIFLCAIALFVGIFICAIVTTK